MMGGWFSVVRRLGDKVAGGVMMVLCTECFTMVGC